MVFGPGDRQRRFAWAIRPMRAGKPTLEIDAQWAAWRTSYGFVDDVAQGLALAAVHPAAAGRTYNLGPSVASSQVTWARRIARRLGWTGEIRLVPRDGLDEARRAAFDALDLRYPLVLDSGRIRAELGYAEVAGPAQVLRRTIEDELSREA
jgi:nucleoside-diphosphate-sugar epimerase